MHHSFNKYPEHKNKSVSFFKRKTLRFVEELRQFQQQLPAPSDQCLVLPSLKWLISLCPSHGSHSLWQKAL